MKATDYLKIVLLQIFLITLVQNTPVVIAKEYQWDEAHKHVGENVVVEGIIKYTNNISSRCFLNFHPNFFNYLSLMIPQDSFSLFPQPPEILYYLKKIRVTGQITTYKDKAQIQVLSPEQIAIIGEYERQENFPPCDCEYPDQLEITSINIGQGDATLIATPSKIMLADVGESFWYSNSDALKIDATIRNKYGENCRCIDYVLNSHFHLDHIGYIYLLETSDDFPLNNNLKKLIIGETPYKPIGYGGLGYLVMEMGYQIGTTFVRDYKNHNPNKSPQDDGSKTFRNWITVLESTEGRALFHPEIINLGKEQIHLGKINGRDVIIDIISVDGATPSYPYGCDPDKFFGGSNNVIRGDNSTKKTPPSENDLSISMVLSFGDFQMYIGGDLSGENYKSEYGYKYHDMETCLANDPYITNHYAQQIEILRVNHHGSSHSSNLEFIKMINPLVSIFSVGDNNTYGHVDQKVLERVCKFSKVVYLTESGDNISSKKDADSKGVIIVDNEFPKKIEENEIGDPNIEIAVSVNGDFFWVQGVKYKSHNNIDVMGNNMVKIILLGGSVLIIGNLLYKKLKKYLRKKK